jgi:protein SEY1
LVSFKAEVVAGLKLEGYNFADVVTKARAEVPTRFNNGAQEAVVTEGDPRWKWTEEFRLLWEEVQSIYEQLRKDETKKVVNTIEVCDSWFLSV